MQTIIIKVNEVVFKIDFHRENKIYCWGFYRNKKILLSASSPLKYKYDLKTDMMRTLMEAMSYEIKHEVEKLVIK
jgi:hypothetical protein